MSGDLGRSGPECESCFLLVLFCASPRHDTCLPAPGMEPVLSDEKSMKSIKSIQNSA